MSEKEKMEVINSILIFALKRIINLSYNAAENTERKQVYEIASEALTKAEPK